jgi:hypothetical protein
VSWVEGRPLAETERSDAALQSLGRMLGRFDAALKGFMHRGALRDLDWDIRHAGRSAARLQHVAAAEDRALIERFLRRFTAIASRLATLRAAVIHNDANDWNVLVDAADAKAHCRPHRFRRRAPCTALICREWRSRPPTPASMHGDPIGAAAAHMLSRLSPPKMPLQPEEVDLLYDLVAIRLVTSGHHLRLPRAAHAADNPYLAISERPAWDAAAQACDRIEPAFIATRHPAPGLRLRRPRRAPRRPSSRLDREEPQEH